MPTPSLEKFTQAVPVCKRTASLAAVLEIFSSSGCDAIVVVSQQQQPLGVINLRQVLPYLKSLARLGENSVAITAAEIHQPIFQLKPSIIKPLAILPAQLSLSQFGDYVQESEDCRSQHWGLVDEDGKFLGLLNSSLLLKSLASKFTATARDNVREEPPSIGFKGLVQLLEQLPLPLSLQTATGEVVAQNLSWSQQIGTSPGWDELKPIAGGMSESPLLEPCATLNSRTVPEGLETLTSPALHFKNSNAELGLAVFPHRSTVLDGTSGRTQREGLPLSVENRTEEPYSPSARATIQRYCAIDTPHMAAAVSKRRVMLSALPMIQTYNDEASQTTSIPPLETQQNNQERIFSFIKIPLPPSFTLQEEKVGGTGGAHLSKASVSPTLSFRDRLFPPASPTPLALPDDVWLVLAQDITEQQQVAKELAAKNADLVHLNRLKDEFLACISHELKTPLTAVLGLSSLLKDQTLGALNERQARYAGLIYHSGRQLMTVVNDILDLTRIETGQLELTLEPVQIQTVCDRAYAQAQQRPSEKNQQDEESPSEIKFTLEIEPGLEMLVADELRLRQMLMHLLSNALKFTDTSGEIGLKVTSWEGWIAFTVWDTGIGIPAQKQHLIFQKFQQLEKPLTRRYEGTGLGLVLTQRLARLHGGDVSFISKPGEGSQFTLLLPPTPPQWNRGAGEQGSREAGEISQSPVLNPQPPTCNRLVLIVETVPRYLEDLTEQLQNLAYRVVIARSGTEAIEKARNFQPCAILLNPLLPQLSGWDVLTLLKSDAQTSHIPAIVTATQAEKQQAYHNKADGFLSLPVQEQALLKSLTDLGDRPSSTTKTVTILHLSPDLSETPSNLSILSCELTESLCLQNSDLNYRVLEADDLDQAELLARVWHPEVMLLESARLADPLAYLKQLSSYTDLISLPLVTLDRQTTEAANQVTGLSVYPCLASDNSSRIAALLQVIQVASGMSRKPSILVMDIGEPKNRGDCPQNSKAQNLTPSTPDTSWLQALIQYLETAGFRSILSCSWTEVDRHLQDRSVDLLLLRLRDTTNPSALVKELISLRQIQGLPPILVLDHRLKASSSDKATTGKYDSTPELESLLRTVSTQILPGHSQSMSQLLHQIEQTLIQK
jgi:signal transduction histidine kinase/CheY-like chemotaxis protein/CBS domain-containing protein